MPVITHVNLARGFRGGERQTELLIRELAARGVSQRVILRAEQPLVSRLADVPHLECMPIRKPFALHINKVRNAFIHAHDGKGAHFAYSASRWAGARYLLTRRVDNRPSGSRRTRRMYEKAARVAVLSRAIQRVMEDYSPGLETTRIPSAAGALAVDVHRTEQLRQAFGDACVIGHVGALDDSQKGQLDLISAVRMLNQRARGWRLILVGGGRDEAMLKAAAADCPNIEFVGHVENVGDYLAAFDLFAFPSRHEGLGSTLLDAMQAGLPIVATAVDGIPELIEDGINGVLVPPGDPTALADALSDLRNQPARAKELGRQGQQDIVYYSASAMAERYLSLYAELGLTWGEQTPA